MMHKHLNGSHTCTCFTCNKVFMSNQVNDIFCGICCDLATSSEIKGEISRQEFDKYLRSLPQQGSFDTMISKDNNE
jgi:hypothetical protein